MRNTKKRPRSVWIGLEGTLSESRNRDAEDWVQVVDDDGRRHWVKLVAPCAKAKAELIKLQPGQLIRVIGQVAMSNLFGNDALTISVDSADEIRPPRRLWRRCLECISVALSIPRLPATGLSARLSQ